MDFFISSALAEGHSGSDSGLLSLLPLVLIFVVFYFIFIRPQQKRTKEHKKMVSELKKGDEVVTNGGIAGTVVNFGDAFVRIKIADNVEINVQRVAIGNLLPKGTIKQL